MKGALSVMRMTRAFGLAAALVVCSLMAEPVFAQAGGAQPSGRPTPTQVRDAWQALRQAMVATRNSDNRAQITEEEAERRFAEHAETARLLIQGYDEPASGKILPPGGTITGDALVGGYFPNLARAYCSWMAAQRTKDPARKYAYYTAVYETLWHGGAGAEKPDAQPRRGSRQLNAVYDSPFVRRMAIAAALARRSIALEQARAAGETEAAGLSVSAEMSDFERLRKLPPAAFNRVDQQADVEDIVGKGGYIEILGKSAQAVLDAELAKAKPAFRLLAERPDWQAEGRTKVISGSVETLLPVTVKVVDAATGQPIPAAVQNNVSGPFDIRLDLEEKPAPTTVKLVLDDPLTKTSVTFGKEIVLWNIPQPTIAIASRTRTIPDVFVNDLSFTAQRVRPGDVVIVEAVESTGTRTLFEQKINDAGDKTVTVPKFTVRPNAETPIRLSIRRGAGTLSPEQIRIVSQTTPTIAGRMLRVNDLVSLIEIEVQDYAERVTRLSMNGVPFPPDVVPVETVSGGADSRTKFVYLVPWTGVGEGVTVGATTVRDAAEVTIAWASQAPAADPNDPRLARVADYQRALASGDLDAGQRAYLGVLTDPAHSREAANVLSDIYDYRIKRAPSGANEEALTYHDNLRILAKAVQRDGDLDARIGQIRAQIQAEQERQRQAQAEREAREAAQKAKEQKEREEAERKAREAQKAREAAEALERQQKTPVTVKTLQAAFTPDDGILSAKLEVSGLVLGRTIKGLRIEDTDIAAPALNALVTPDPGDATRATIEFVAVPAVTSGSIRVAVTVAYPGTGEVPVQGSVSLTPGSHTPGGAIAAHLAFLKTARPDPAAQPPAWLIGMARRRMQHLNMAATSAVASLKSDRREANAVASASKTIAAAIEYGEALKAVTGSDEASEAKTAQAALRDAIQPKLTIEGVSLIRKPEGFALAEGAAVRVQSWADSVAVKFGDKDLAGNRSGGEWRFSLAGLPGRQGAIKITARTSGPDGTPLSAEQDVTLELPASSVALNYYKPDFVYCDDGTGKRSLVYSANASGRNDNILIGYDPPQAKLMAWAVYDAKDNKVEGTDRAPLAPPLDGIAIPAGKLRIGSYTVRVQLWDSNDPNQTPATHNIPVRIAPRAVAFIVGINYYPQSSGMPPLQHAADDAMALRNKLIQKGYAPENIIYLIGRNDSGTPEVRTNGLQNPRSETPNDLSEVRRVGQLNGIARKKYVDTAFDNFLNVLRARQAVHALIFFAGHGTNVPATLGGSGGALNVDHLIMADDEKDAPAKLWVYAWPTRIKGSIKWCTAEAPATVMCIYDACRNGTRAVFDALPPELRSDDRAVVASALFSCQKGEQANENVTTDPKLAVAYQNEVFNNGFFTYALLKGLDELPDGGARLPDVIDKAGSVLSALVQQTSEKNRLASGGQKPYSERQSLRPKDDLRRWEDPLYVIYPVQRTDTGSLLRLMRWRSFAQD
jgi:hypothetical protein